MVKMDGVLTQVRGRELEYKQCTVQIFKGENMKWRRLRRVRQREEGVEVTWRSRIARNAKTHL